MAKKSINSNNLVLVLSLIIFLFFIHFYYVHFMAPKSHIQSQQHATYEIQRPYPPINLMPISARRDPFNDPYAPPLSDAVLHIYPRSVVDIRGVQNVPINIETQGLQTQYEQVGILTSDNKENLILPLMGRRSMVSRDKWQYYTISNTGPLNTKLPITFEGRSCTSENGCNNINNGDIVYVKGYNDKFRVTIYETNLLQYIPVI